jgi:hypothetical protein
MCPELALGKGQGVVVGHARNAATEHPLIGATVVVSWTELAVDRATLKSKGEEKIAAVATDDRGEFRLCGVPTGSSLSLQLQHGDDASAEVKLAVSENEGVVARDLSLSADTVASGSAMLAGTVRGAGGQPLANAELRVVGARSSAVSDATGRYSLAALPSGTRMLTVRRIGYEVLETPVELRTAQTVQRDVQMLRVVSLDSMRVVALRSQLPEFEYNRKANPFGIYLGPEEVERRRKVSQTADMLVGLPGVTVSGHGVNAQVGSVHGRNGANKCVGMRLVVDGYIEGMTFNDVPPSAIAAIEVYTQGAFAPSQYSRARIVRSRGDLDALVASEAARSERNGQREGRQRAVATMSRLRIGGVRRVSVASLLLALVPSAALVAQSGQRSGRLEGTVTDSLRAAPFGGATVRVTRIGSEPEVTLSAVTDRIGRYRFEPPRRGHLRRERGEPACSIRSSTAARHGACR